MFSSILKWAARIVSCLLVAVLVLYGVFSFLFRQHASKKYSVTVRNIPIPDDSSTIAEGRHLYGIKGCGECHGADLRGKIVIDDPAIGRIAGSNITYGTGGLPESYDNDDWLKALRHGLNAANKPLLLMPSEEFTRMDDHDIAAIIAFCRAQPKIDAPSIPIRVGPLGKILSVSGRIPLFPAEKIDHLHEQPAQVVKTATKEYGQYLAVSCTGCHKPALTGGDNPVPGATPVANITSTGHVGKWNCNEFITTLRTGRTPEGKQLQVKDMPWNMTARYTDEELTALYLYLRSL